MQRWLDIATLIQPKRTDGGLVAEAAAGLPFLLSEGMRVCLVPPQTDLPRQVTVASVADERDRSSIVHFEEVRDREQAEALAGCHCIVERVTVEALIGDGAPAAALFDGFIGWTVSDRERGDVGDVIDCVEHPQQLTLTVRTEDGSEKLIPLVDELLLDADEGARILRMDLPAGILEL